MRPPCPRCQGGADPPDGEAVSRVAIARARESDDERSRLAELLSRLPVEARADVEDCIVSYRNGTGWWSRTRPASNSLRPELERMRQVILDLAKRIRRVGGGDLGELMALMGIQSVDRSRVEKILSDLMSLSDSLAIARNKLKRKRGPNNDAARQLVRTVAALIEVTTSTRIAQSDKAGSLAETLREIVAIADPTIGRGTINEALKARARMRRGEIKH